MTMDSQKAQDISKLIYELALRACRKQVLVFSKELKKKMLSMGFDKPAIQNVIQEAFKGYSTMETFKSECASNMLEILEVYITPSNRGFDPMGRILTEFGIIRAFDRPVLFNDGEHLDKTARKQFSKGVIPRPLLRYFLVAVRGTIDNLEQFYAKPVLFGPENESMKQYAEDVEALVDEFTTRYKYGKTITDWSGIYGDIRTQNLVFDLLDDVLSNLLPLGPERFLKIINNIQNNDQDPNNSTKMNRLFTTNDIRQLLACLQRGHKKLAAQLGHG